jgi:hypothetical protein
METVIALMREPQVVRAQWPLRVVDADGQWHGKLSTKQSPPDGDLRRRIIQDGPLYDFEFHTGSAYRQEFLTQVLPMPEAPYRNGGDVYLITLAPIFGEVRTAQRPLGTYRAHGGNNFRDRPLSEELIRNYVQRFESNCSVLAQLLDSQGEQPNIYGWKQRNFNYLWPTRWLRAISEIEALIPVGNSYLIINNNEWGEGEPVRGRHAIPFLERNGEYWGPPPDDETAIAELLRLRWQHDAAYIAFIWTAFWWLDHYSEFHAWLCSNAKCVLNNDRLIVFDIRELEIAQECGKC